MTSEATVICHSVSRGTPPSRPPRPMTARRRARSLMSTTRGQRIAERVDPERVAVVEAVVEERRGEVVGRADRVDVAGQVEVEVLHRDDLAVAAAGRPALDPEDRAERGLADRGRGPLPDPVEALGEADRGGRLALAERRRGDRGDERRSCRAGWRPRGARSPRASPSPSSGRTARARRRPSPSSAATSRIGRGVTARAISRSEGKLMRRTPRARSGPSSASRGRPGRRPGCARPA